MNRLSRALVVAAALAVATMLVTPLWTVHLGAPQYPEGLGMTIHINTVRGASEFDLMKINQLNHYIGMKVISPDAIPELKVMPWIVAALAVAGLAVAAMGRRRWLMVWLGAFALFGAVGIADFWRWEYDYGHDLDFENAIIKVPGMTYQPPLIGTKQLLNFSATSWPDVGGVLAGVAFALGVAALVLAYRHRRVLSSSSLRAGVLAATVACAAGPHVIRVGIDICNECRMLVSDARFGAQVITKTGKTLTFDSIECMNKYVAGIPARDVRETWVVDASHPGTLIRVADATERHDGVLHPPMGATYTVATANAR